MTDQGVLTLANQHDYLKAVGLAFSIRRTTPGMPIALVSSPKVAKIIGKFFDRVEEENKELRGWEHKLFLDQYSPFKKTLFLDADILVFKNLRILFSEWKNKGFAVAGGFRDSGKSYFGLDRKAVLEKIQKPKLVFIEGAGHYYFEKPDCLPVFEKAREILHDYSAYVRTDRIADEDVMAITMTLLDIAPADRPYLVSRTIFAKRGTLKIDALNSQCSFIDKRLGERQEPFFVHFLAGGMDAPILYARELERLFRANGIKPRLLWWVYPLFFQLRTIWWKFKNCWPRYAPGKTAKIFKWL